MRIEEAYGYSEPRDAIAQDWSQLLKTALPKVPWLCIPNLGGNGAVEFCQNWNINRLILTGGHDIGKTPLRDETEWGLLSWAESREFPVLGICRGMQLMGAFAGIDCRPVEAHVATRHKVTGEICRDVNSYHNQVLSACPENYAITATSDDGSIEAIRHVFLPWHAWMWHPERENPTINEDVEALRRVLL